MQIKKNIVPFCDNVQYSFAERISAHYVEIFDGENLHPYIVFFPFAPSRIRGQNEMVPKIPFCGILAQIGGPFPMSPEKLTRNVQNRWASYLSARSNYNFSGRVILVFFEAKTYFSII